MVWTHGQESLLIFLEALNKTHPAVSFTWEISDTEVHFLDLTICKSSTFGTLSYCPFHKPTNHFMYVHVHANSHHPQSTNKAVIKGEALRLMRACSDERTFVPALQTLKLAFRDRGYSNAFIASALAKLPSFSQRYNPNPKINTTLTFFFKTVFDFRRPPLKPLLTQNIAPLTTDLEMGKVFSPGSQVLVCHKNPKSLTKLLTRSALPGDCRLHQWNTQDPGGTSLSIATVTSPCGQRGCLTCKVITSTSIFTCHSTGERIPIRMNCRSRNLIYIIQCGICNKQYVGQTSTPLHIPMNRHRSRFNLTLEHTDRYLLYKHLDRHGGLKVTPIVTVEDASLLKRTEMDLIKRLHTVIPHGLNSGVSVEGHINDIDILGGQFIASFKKFDLCETSYVDTKTTRN